jgi:hypothetical protein
MTRTTLAVALALILAGCVVNSDIVPAGKDSFMVVSTARGGATGTIDAVKAANQYCGTESRQMIIRRMDTNGVPGLSPVSSTLVFSCVSADDPEYRRPNLQHEPNVRIQQTD